MTDLATETLTAQEKAILHAACLPRRKRRATAVDLGISTTRMAQTALHLLDDPRAARELPAIVRCLRARQEWSRGRL